MKLQFYRKGKLGTSSKFNLVIGNVDLGNPTFSGTYGTLDNGTMTTYPFHGEFDPNLHDNNNTIIG